MTGTSEGGRKAADKQNMSEKGRKGGEQSQQSKNAGSQQGSGRGSNLTEEDRRKGGEHSHGGR